jgi:hypothetical protein
MTTLSLWAIAVPPGSTPDEGYHAATTWCVRGEVKGRCERLDGDSQLGPSVKVPYFTDYCFNRGPEFAASCQSEISAKTLVIQSRMDRVDTRSLYYWVQSLLISTDPRVSLVAMRIFNASIFVFVVTSILYLLHARLRSAALAGLLLLLVPQGAYLIPSINPSSWAISAVSTNWAFLYALIHKYPSQKRKWVGAVYLVTLGLSFARLESLGFIIFTTACVLVSSIRARRFTQGPVLIGAITVTLLLTVASRFGFITAFVSSVRNASSNSGGIDFFLYWLLHLVDIPAFSLGVNYQDFGPLGGSLEILMPPIVPVIMIGLIALVAFLIVTHYSLSLLIFHLASASFLYLVLIQQLAAEMTYNPYWVQGRYILPLLPFLIAYSFVLSNLDVGRIHKPQLKFLGSFLAIAHSVTLLTVIQRYSLGSQLSVIKLFSQDSWSYFPNIDSSLIWLFGSLAFALMIWSFVNLVSLDQQHENRVDTGVTVENLNFN